MRLSVAQLHSLLLGEERHPQKTFVLLDREDPHVDWADIQAIQSPPQSSVSVGQLWDLRRPLPGGSALHVHVHHSFVTVHLDVYDPAMSPVSHVVAETYAVRGAVAGGAASLFLGLASGPALILTALAALIGGSSAVDARYLRFVGLDRHGAAHFEPLGGAAARELLR